MCTIRLERTVNSGDESLYNIMKFGYVIYGDTLLFKNNAVMSLVCIFRGPSWSTSIIVWGGFSDPMPDSVVEALLKLLRENASVGNRAWDLAWYRRQVLDTTEHSRGKRWWGSIFAPVLYHGLLPRRTTEREWRPPSCDLRQSRNLWGRHSSFSRSQGVFLLVLAWKQDIRPWYNILPQPLF